MKNIELWKPTKYEMRGGRLRASSDRAYVGPSSILICDLVAAFYENQFPLYCKGDLMDLGCGSVPLYSRYQPYVESVTCVDWGASAHNVSYADVLCDLNGALPLDSASCDTVILSDVLEHLHRPQDTFAEIARILRPGGHLIATTPFLYWLHEAPHDYYRYTRFAIERMAGEVEMEVVALEELGGAFDVLVDLIGKSLMSRRRVFGPAVAAMQRFASWRTRRWPSRGTGSQYLQRLPLEYGFVIKRP